MNRSRSIGRRGFLRGVIGISLSAIVTKAASAGLSYDDAEVWPRNLIRALQERLAEVGFNPGPADGIYGPKTARAIRAFQRYKGLTQDGQISEELLQALEMR